MESRKIVTFVGLLVFLTITTGLHAQEATPAPAPEPSGWVEAPPPAPAAPPAAPVAPVAPAAPEPAPAPPAPPAPEPPAVVPAAEPEKKSCTLPSKIGPFEIKSADGQSSLQFNLAAQLLFHFDSKELSEKKTDENPNPGNYRDNTGTVEMRRIRPQIRGMVLTQDLEYNLQLSMVPGNIELIDFYLNYRIVDHARFRLGWYKIPFTRYRIQSFKELTLPDWSIVTKYFGAERQFGLSIHNGYEKPMEVEYEFGVFTGQNSRASHAVALPKLYGEEAPNPSSLTDPAAQNQWHPEVVWRVAWNPGGIVTRTDTDFEGGSARVSLGLSGAWDFRPKRYIDLNLRVAPEFLLKAYGFSMSLVGYVATQKMGDSLSNTQLAFAGGLAQASYLIAKRYELAARYSFVSTNSETREDAFNRGQNIINDPENAEDVEALKKQYDKLGQTKYEQELCGGFNVYIIGSSLKWNTDVSYLPRTTLKDRRDDVRVRSQIQVAF